MAVIRRFVLLVGSFPSCVHSFIVVNDLRVKLKQSFTANHISASTVADCNTLENAFPAVLRWVNMSTVPESWYPFDGKCYMSGSGDIDLTFGSEAPLKAHSNLLSLASSVLRTAVTHCGEPKSLDLSGDSRYAWLAILNGLHPVSSTAFDDSLREMSNTDLVSTTTCIPFRAKYHLWLCPGDNC